MGSVYLRPYDSRMLSRHHWIAEFVGYVLRRGLSDDPDWVFSTASELHPEWGDLNPEFAADSAFGPEGLQPR
jgi:hypothetical protein